MPLNLAAAILLLCLRGATGLHARPATPLSPRRLSRVRSAVPVCAEDGADSDEIAKARRQRDEQALQAEWRDGLAPNAKERDGALREEELRMLRERIDLIETKETQISEMKEMLRAMGAPLGLQLVDEANQFTASAWVFVGLNFVVFLYGFYILLAAPLANSAALLTGSS